MRPRIVVVGDGLLDRDWTGVAARFSPDGPVPVIEDPDEVLRAGGALLPALAAADRADVVVITALGRDPAGDELRRRVAGAGVELMDLGLDGPTPEKIRLRAGGQTVARVDRASRPAPPGDLSPAARSAIAGADAVLVADYGRGLIVRPDVRTAVAAAARHRPVVWDPHRLGPRPVRGTDLATPNVPEARSALGDPSADSPVGLAAVASLAERLRDRWHCPVATTAGPLGAALADDGAVALAPATPVTGDPCGAGDHLAAACTIARSVGIDRPSAVRAAVAAASAHVAGERATATGLPGGDAQAVADHTRATGGTVVAAGGCFDLLHAGHVALLSAARSLGDCLIVFLNGDESVRRLKGRGRPVNTAADRAAVLLALGCVDAVEVFDEDTPSAALARIRPHLFIKGADYAGAPLPEEAVLGTWGGRVVLLPLIEERSTTGIIRRLSEVPA
jgi:D-beta-D-heptose 7-phosphate kinase / D-beta-D-heptose 1-phosphate adenosyltransferase